MNCILIEIGMIKENRKLKWSNVMREFIVVSIICNGFLRQHFVVAFQQENEKKKFKNKEEKQLKL